MYGMCLGRCELKMTRPTVVWMNWRSMLTDFRVGNVLVVVRGDEVDHFAGVAQTNRSEQFDFAGFESERNVFGSAEYAAFALGAGFGLGQVIDAENHVLRRNGQRQTVRGRKNVARAEHEHRGFDLGFRRKRNVHGHLVAVKVRVERGADERVNTDGFAFDEGAVRKPECPSGARWERG